MNLVIFDSNLHISKRILKFNQFVFLLIIVLICGNGCDSDENDDSNNFTPQSGTQISGEIEGVLSYNDSPFKIIDNLTIDYTSWIQRDS